MKKKLLFGALGVLFLSAGIFTAVTLTEKEKVSDLTLANIEAMTQVCYEHESFEGQRSRREKCPNRTTRVYCVTGNGICVIQPCS